MIPLVMVAEELRRLRELVTRVMDAELAAAGVAVPYTIGTMIELPRACVVADRIAEHADFFSFGTNDLTQTTFGLSRDDAGKFLPAYLEADVIEVELAIGKGRGHKAGLKIGICGEHGGDPASVELCHELGFDYVSCSPFRVPIARVAAARAELHARARGGKT
jgi:pyruvate,orthophosphate dikinase